ncbi:hypothetical protein HDV05_007378 [Chytridiales sp. JEL 0842]|nr:hypothetical protein HDV05_007378 [Chytridiales sp. JEL 0842]
MGLTSSSPIKLPSSTSSAVNTSPEVTESKSSKTRAINAIETADKWRDSVLEFFVLCEQAAFTAALWAEDERDEAFTSTFRNVSLMTTELPLIHRDFLKCLDAHLALLADLLALQREHHDSIKRLVKARLYSNKVSAKIRSRRRAIEPTGSSPSRQISYSNLSYQRRSQTAPWWRRVFRKTSTSLPVRRSPYKRSYSLASVAPEPLQSEPSAASTSQASLLGIPSIDTAPESQAQSKLQDCLAYEIQIFTRLEKAKEKLLPDALLELIERQGEMWMGFYQLTVRLKGLCEVVGRGHDHSPSQPLMVNTEPSPEFNELVHKKRLKLLKKWRELLDCTLEAWKDMREHESLHIRSCMDWWLSDGKAHMMLLPYPPSNSSLNEPFHCEILEKWMYLLSAPSSTTDLSTNPTQHHIFQSLQTIEASLGKLLNILNEALSRETEILYLTSNLDKASKAASSVFKKVANDQGRKLSTVSPTLSSGAGGGGALTSNAAKTLHRLDTARAKLEKGLGDNRNFRRNMGKVRQPLCSNEVPVQQMEMNKMQEG